MYRVYWDSGEVVCIDDVGHLVHVQRLQHLVVAAGSLQCVVLHPTKPGAQRAGDCYARMRVTGLTIPPTPL